VQVATAFAAGSSCVCRDGSPSPWLSAFYYTSTRQYQTNVIADGHQLPLHPQLGLKWHLHAAPPEQYNQIYHALADDWE
jgi:hypothetical protein